MEDIFSELRPVSQEDVSRPAGSSGPEWNVAHVNHSRVAALTLHGKASLRSGFRQCSRLGSCGDLTLKLSSLTSNFGRLDFEASLHVEAISGQSESGMDFFPDFYALRYLALSN